jgi:hypothetical protein
MLVPALRKTCCRAILPGLLEIRHSAVRTAAMFGKKRTEGIYAELSGIMSGSDSPTNVNLCPHDSSRDVLTLEIEKLNVA